MKKSIHLIIVFLLCAFFAQAQRIGMNYQAALLKENSQNVPGENPKASPLNNSEIMVRFTIVNQNLATVFEEVHTTTTDDFGIINLFISSGVPIQGSFKLINWNGDRKYLNVHVDFTASGNNFELFEDGVELLYMPQPLCYNDSLFVANIDVNVNANLSAIAANTVDILDANTNIANNTVDIVTTSTAIAENTADIVSVNAAITNNTVQ